jgi:hypothetical protein
MKEQSLFPRHWLARIIGAILSIVAIMLFVLHVQPSRDDSQIAIIEPTIPYLVATYATVQIITPLPAESPTPISLPDPPSPNPKVVITFTPTPGGATPTSGPGLPTATPIPGFPTPTSTPIQNPPTPTPTISSSAALLVVSPVQASASCITGSYPTILWTNVGGSATDWVGSVTTATSIVSLQPSSGFLDANQSSQIHTIGRYVGKQLVVSFVWSNGVVTTTFICR